ncbi:MAG: MFS transporter [Acidobacteria bacterium]|nr:MFS transporter [Acidobacteriota bacterium]
MSESVPSTRPAPPRAYRWLVLVFISLAMFGNYYVYDCIGPLAPLLSRNGFSDSSIGLLQAIYSFPNIVMVLIGGFIIDRIGTKKSTLLFGAICFIGAVVTAWPEQPVLAPLGLAVNGLLSVAGSIFGATSVPPVVAVMAAGRLLFGLGAESLIVAVTTAIARWFKGKELSFAFGINLTISRLGSLGAQVSPSWAGSAYTTWQGPLVLSVGFGAFCIIGAVLYWLLESNASRRYALGDAGKTDKVVFRDLLGFGRSYWFIVLLCVTFYSGIFPFQTFAQKYFIDTRQTSAELASWLVGMLTVFAMIGTPSFGALVDRIGKRASLMFLGAALLIPVYAIIGYTNISLYLPMAMMGIAFSLIPAVMWPSVAYVVEERRLGTAYGLMTMIQNIGLFGFNLLVGVLNDQAKAGPANPSGYHAGMVWAFSGLGFAALLFAFLLRRSETGPRAHGLETIKA